LSLLSSPLTRLLGEERKGRGEERRRGRNKGILSSLLLVFLSSLPLLAGLRLDTGFPVISMHATGRAVFLQHQSFGIVLFILVARVVPVLALCAG